jgi:hypothetical protein
MYNLLQEVMYQYLYIHPGPMIKKTVECNTNVVRYHSNWVRDREMFNRCSTSFGEALNYNVRQTENNLPTQLVHWWQYRRVVGMQYV